MLSCVQTPNKTRLNGNKVEKCQLYNNQDFLVWQTTTIPQKIDLNYFFFNILFTVKDSNQYAKCL